MNTKEFDEILNKYKEVDEDTFIKKEIDKLMNKILEGEKYERNKKIDIILTTFFISVWVTFIVFLNNPPLDNYVKILIFLMLILTSISIFLMLWNYFRIPARFKLFREILERCIEESGELHDIFNKKITIPYLELLFEYRCLLDKNFDLKNNEAIFKEKFLEITNVIELIFKNYLNINFKLQFQTVVNKPFKSDKFPKFQFFVDNFAYSKRYYLVALTFLSIFLYAIYCLAFIYWK